MISNRVKSRPPNPIKGKPSGIPIPKKMPLSKAELWASYGLNRPAKPRYEGLKGIYWHVVSLYVRTRDLKQWSRCISCSKWVTDISELQGGHFIAAGTGGIDLLFDLTNINGECGYCNGFDGNHLVRYELGLDERYGKGTAKKLKERYLRSRRGTPMKGLNNKEYHEKILQMKAAIETL